jgi:hypothetical protein
MLVNFVSHRIIFEVIRRINIINDSRIDGDDAKRKITYMCIVFELMLFFIVDRNGKE